ncbi:MAG: hypothetical protein HY869_14500 [Chloroflexi bacterium]|nr:hypothetical protein [Chloroflexota bacterium]
MDSSRADLERISTLTAQNLRSVAHTLSAEKLSHLSLPEVDKVVELVSQVIPAGNVPGMILSGLARLPGLRPSPQKVNQDIHTLFQEVERALDQIQFGAFFAGPAAVIWGYQNLLKLAGKDPESSFPEGTWQFYVDYALREDTARHTNETHGFDSLLRQHRIRLSEVDRVTAWAMAAITCVHQFDALLANEWYERIATYTLELVTRGTPQAAQYRGLFRAWEGQRPYRREAEAADLDYPAYRRFKFEQFLATSLHSLPRALYAAWSAKLKAALQSDLPAYQRQMSILAYLDPGPYGETRVPYHLGQAHIAIIHAGNYYLLPVCEPGTKSPMRVDRVRAQVAAMLRSQAGSPARLVSLARIKREALPALRHRLNPVLSGDIEKLRFAPILLNMDTRTRALPLSELRQAERGVGDHPLTVFNTGETFVFDQSHIFFDGAWGAALAEILTNEALSWAGYLKLLGPAVSDSQHLYTALTLPLEAADVAEIQQATHLAAEVGAENARINVKACMNLRKLFKQRNDLLQLTINDLLVLYRAIHAFTYLPSPALLAELSRLAETRGDTHQVVLRALDPSNRINPSLLIPIDASQRNPRDRLYPLNLEVPLADLDLLGLHARTIRALDRYESGLGDRTDHYTEFDRSQRLYLASLAGFGLYLSRAKEVAGQGQSVSVGAIKLLAHLPPALQRLLDKVPERFELINNLIKGQEVFSNIGAVAQTSSLTRFITAKDDNEKKQLVWGVMTDANGLVQVSLRDFRPHVTALLAAGRKDLASLVTQDYLDAYAQGLNDYVHDLFRITTASRETQPLKPLQGPR